MLFQANGALRRLQSAKNALLAGFFTGIQPGERETGDLRFGEAVVLAAVAGAVGEEDVVARGFDGGVAVPAVGIVEESAGGLPGLAVVFGNGGGEGRALTAKGGIDL